MGMGDAFRRKMREAISLCVVAGLVPGNPNAKSKNNRSGRDKPSNRRARDRCFNLTGIRSKTKLDTTLAVVLHHVGIRSAWRREKSFLIISGGK